MRVIDKFLAFMSISATSMVMGQFPFFLQRFRPKSGLQGLASSYASLFSPLPSASFLSPSYSSGPSLFGSSSSSFGPSFGSFSLGSSPVPSTNFGSLSLGSSPLPSTSFGSLGLGSSPFSSTGYGPPSFGPSFSSSGFGSSFIPPSGSSSFSSSGLGNPVLSSASNFGSPSLGYSPFAAASFSSPTIGSPSLRPPKFDPSSLGSSPLSEFSSSGSFDGLGELDPIDLIEDYPGFSNAGFGKDLNFAGSHPPIK
ncbi:hypothetical protein AVEN_25510-1 [Araneus ventricosus]|uniref:Uncharacterized protein n=1 Tax=Araneus ventricosus TaxID=182803 RepID=A0A4Y2KLS8_ARAVE|nr:hypothetical protein AVEN_25510-1 [Araneus ventricosus]